MPSFSHTLDINAAPAEVFEILDDLDKTPLWLKRCTGIDKIGAQENSVGTKLRYHYKQGRQSGTMVGEIIAREPARHLAFAYIDKMMNVSVDFAMAAAGDGHTSLTHTIAISPMGFGKLLGPIIKRQLPGQTIDAMTRLKGLAEK